MKISISNQSLLRLLQLNVLMMDEHHVQHWRFHDECIWKHMQHWYQFSTSSAAKIDITYNLEWSCYDKPSNLDAVDGTLHDLFQSVFPFQGIPLLRIVKILTNFDCCEGSKSIPNHQRMFLKVTYVFFVYKFALAFKYAIHSFAQRSLRYIGWFTFPLLSASNFSRKATTERESWCITSRII